jgi:GH15 family glucan-1,4-alpha-glucosidase
MMDGRNGGYLPLRDYALIGDAHTAALVARDGSIDWCCWPHFDSPAVFCRLLDADKGGFFRVGPAGRHTAARSYAGPTNVLETTFEAEGGAFRLTDLMPIERLDAARRGEDVAASCNILRLVEGLRGEVEVEVSFRPTFDYARAPTSISACAGGAVAHDGGRRSLTLSCPVPLRRSADGALVGRFRLGAGERVWLSLVYRDDADPRGLRPELRDAEARLAGTLAYWEEWWRHCSYEGPYRDLVRRSALVLKLLTFEPTGALVAAPTTSLPEEVGGVRNWDYRFTWLRDSALTIYALQLLGYKEEATDFFDWLDRLCLACRGEVQIMYSVRGESRLTEQTLAHLSGYRGSRPVRIGNAAYEQRQLDVYGEVLDAVHLYHEMSGRPVREEWWDEVCLLAGEAAARWREPDYGIWEVRGGKQHFFYSKLMCWVALDRAVKLAARSGHAGEVKQWARARDEIRRAILAEGYNAEVGAFTQVCGGRALDASALAVPFTGFLPATDPRVLSTVRAIREQLTSHGLVYRYLTGDGLPGGEATFAMCTFWLADNLALGGRTDEAREVFERVVSYASDTGLLAEEIDPSTGELLGNYPQGFTHLALVRTALHLQKAEALGAEDRAEDAAERASHVEDSGRLRRPDN